MRGRAQPLTRLGPAGPRHPLPVEGRGEGRKGRSPLCSTNSFNRTIDRSYVYVFIVPRPALRGASTWDAVKTEQRRGRAGDVVQTHRVGQAGKPRRRLMRRRGSGATHSRLPGDGGAPLAGITTCRQELADRRGWSTFSEARPDQSLERRKWSAGRRLSSSEGRGRLRKASHRAVSPTAHREPRKLPRLPALRSPRGSAMRRETRACPGPTKEYGRWRMPCAQTCTRK